MAQRRHVRAPGRYVAAVARELGQLGRAAVGLRGPVSSDLPTGVGLSSSAALRRELERALAAIGGRLPHQVDPAELDELTARMDDVPARRLRHVVAENRRGTDTVAALSAPDRRRPALPRAGGRGHAHLIGATAWGANPSP